MAARLVEERLRAEMLERDARILELFAEHAGSHRGPAAALSPAGRIVTATGGWGPVVRGRRLELTLEESEIELADGTGAAVLPLGEGRSCTARPDTRSRSAPSATGCARRSPGR